jgi:hypothetical protein
MLKDLDQAVGQVQHLDVVHARHAVFVNYQLLADRRK